MTCFVLSHNLQVRSASLPPLSAAELASGLQESHEGIQVAEPLSHPHWLARIEIDADPQEASAVLVQAWRSLRAARGDSADHHVLALGGRKDSEAAPGSPLQPGSWGVDVVETNEPDGFLQAINWDGLKQGRPADGVFERRG